MHFIYTHYNNMHVSDGMDLFLYSTQRNTVSIPTKCSQFLSSFKYKGRTNKIGYIEFWKHKKGYCSFVLPFSFNYRIC